VVGDHAAERVVGHPSPGSLARNHGQAGCELPTMWIFTAGWQAAWTVFSPAAMVPACTGDGVGERAAERRHGHCRDRP
jgi:hypothetical protein